jgi:hypothetical protein
MFFEYIQLEDYLSEILGVKVDLVMKSVLKPAIGKHALEEVTEGIYRQVGDYWKLMDQVCRPGC